ncbi:MAG TPA: hypothetical protein VFH88_12305 [Candidatus Krumholzibacteria bacterium]|nr:hypothetical protein [Candidatus Krumholzibacteria bacterium]
MKPRHTVLLAALIALPVLAGGDRPTSNSTAPTAINSVSNTPAFAAGQVIVLDPSGKISPSQLAENNQLILGEAASTSAEGLVEVKSPVKGGGTMVNLQGRFQNAMTMTVDANGKVVSAPCVPSETVPASGEVK